MSESEENIKVLANAINEIKEYIKHDPYIEQKTYLDNLPQFIKACHLRTIFEISEVTVWQWEKKGIIIPLQINGRKFYNKADVLDMCKKRVKKYFNR